MRRLVIIVLAGGLLAAPAARAQDDRAAACAQLLAGDGGAPFSNDVRKPADSAFAAEDQGNMSGGGEGTVAADGRDLPARVKLRTPAATFNARYWFALRDGYIYVKSNADRTGIRQPWRRLVLPDCIEGRVREISSDGTNLAAIDETRRVYTATGALLAPVRFAWTARWGPYLWAGLGWKLPADVIDWAMSDISADQDGTWRDRAGRDNKIAGVTTIYQLRSDSTTITYNDPWLPNDESYEVCGPLRGRFRAAGMSASGATLLLVGRHGELYTRLYDFDVSGANTVLLDYSYDDPDKPRLPAPDWVRQPTVPGRPTNVAHVSKHGLGSINRTLRVQGRDRRGRAGYFRKELSEARWTFVPTGGPLRGRLLPRLPRRSRVGPLAPALNLHYVRDVAGGWSAEIADFHPACSPASMRVRFDDGATLDLVVHTVDALRQQLRGRRLENGPREYLGAVEIPAAVFERRATLPGPVRAFIDGPLGGRRFTHTAIVAAETGLRFTDLCWDLRAASAPPGSPAPEMPAARDPGEMLGILTSANQGRRQWPPPAC